MTLFDPTFAAMPGIERRRSTPHTVGAAVGLVLVVVGLVLLSQNVLTVAEWARDGLQDSSRARYRTGAGLMVPMLYLAGFFLIGYSIRYLLVDARPWTRTATGTRLRSRYEGWYLGDARFFEQLYARLATGDPTVYTPMPERDKRGHSGLRIWTAAADRTAYVGLTWGPRRKTTLNAPMIVLTGPAYDALLAAKRARFEKPSRDAERSRW